MMGNKCTEGGGHYSCLKSAYIRYYMVCKYPIFDFTWRQNHRKSEIGHIISNMESFGTSHFRYYMIFAPYKIENRLVTNHVISKIFDIRYYMIFEPYKIENRILANHEISKMGIFRHIPYSILHDFGAM